MEIGPGTRALVTGASSGIGRALAQALAARGARVGLLARRRDRLEAVADGLPGGRERHPVLAADVADRDAVHAAVEAFAAATGGLELVAANAGLTHYGPFAEQPAEHVVAMTEANWYGTVWTVQAALGHLLRAPAGHVVVVSSGGALRSFPSSAVYNATKAAQRAFAEALRHELAGTGVSVTTVFPGEIATALHDHERDRMPDWYRGAQAATPDELAEKIVAAVREDRRAVHHPPIVRLLGALHNLSPRLSDALLRRIRGESAAPRRG
ncbi:MAG: SDR family NAD(P)-dependent oxidoreductase [Solirubrobacteraceae bacterium]|nr:SDR family NAD(P)-dependent oxidoreductase [Solirubrobacteraceae bacterium]